jgi:outer membrane protein TolC
MSDRPVSGGAIGARILVFASLAIAVAGCRQGLFDDDTSTWRVAPDRLQRIASTDVVGLSRTPPVSPEDATAAALAKADPSPVWPQQTELTLAEVREATIRHNLELRTQLIDPEIAQRTIDAERAKFESTLFASYTRNGSNQFTDSPFAETDSDAMRAGVNVPLATGGVVDVFGDLNRNDTDFDVDGAGEWSTGLGFSISQPLLRNAGTNANTASIRIAEYNGQIASARTKLEVTRVLATADRAYWDLYAAFRELEVRKQQYTLAIAQRDRARRLVEQEQAPRIEVTRAESGVGQTLEQIIVADANLRDRVRSLKRLMNRPDLPVESSTLLVPKTEPNPLGLELDTAQLADDAVGNRMELLELELQLAQDATNIALARNQALPLFAVEYSYQPLGSGGSAGRAIRNIGDWESDPYTIGVRGEIPLGNEAAKNRLARAILERVQRLASKDDRRQAIRTEVYDAVDRLQTAWQRILAARLETVLAARTFEAEQRQFDVGVRTSQDVLDASTRLADAQSREVSALAQWQIALVDIAFATGTLPGAAGVVWTPIDIEELRRQSESALEMNAIRSAEE